MKSRKGSHPGGAPGLQNRRGALNVPGGFDSYPFPPFSKYGMAIETGGLLRLSQNCMIETLLTCSCQYEVVKLTVSLQ